MRFRIVYISHILCFVLGVSVTLLFLSYDIPEHIPHIEKEKFRCIILILSAPDNVEKRAAVRETWVKFLGTDFLHLFIIGSKDISSAQRSQIVKEHKSFGDILLVPVVDAYGNLSLKVLRSFQEVNSVYDFTYLIKTDDDTFLNIQELKKALRLTPKQFLYWGYFSGNARVYRRGKWKELNWFLCDRYLPYALGGAYILTKDLVDFIAKNGDNFRLYRSEDVTVGTWLAPLNVFRMHDTRFDTGTFTRGCQDDVIAVHDKSPDQLRIYHRRLMDGLGPCPEVKLKLQPYHYNWSVLPSQCCRTVR